MYLREMDGTAAPAVVRPDSTYAIDAALTWALEAAREPSLARELSAHTTSCR